MCIRDSSYALQMVGYMANVVLPLRIGEIVRGALVGSRTGLSKSTGLATVVVERLLDVFSLLVLIGIAGSANAFLVSPIEGFGAYIGKGALVFGITAVLMSVFVAYLMLFKGPQSRLVTGLTSWLPSRLRRRLLEMMERFIAGFEILKSGRHYAVIAVETALLWVLYGLQVYLVICAFGFHHLEGLVSSAPVMASMVVLLVSAVGLSVPSAPSGVGTFHAACMLGVSLVGVADRDSAAGFAVTIHVISVVFYVVVGLIFMWREGMHLGQLKGIAERHGGFEGDGKH